MSALEVEKKQLLQDVRQVLTSTEDLICAAGDEGGEKFRKLLTRTSENLKASKERLLEIEQTLVCKTKDAVRVTDDYVNDNPWKAVSAAAGIGLLLGILISRR